MLGEEQRLVAALLDQPGDRAGGHAVVGGEVADAEVHGATLGCAKWTTTSAERAGMPNVARGCAAGDCWPGVRWRSSRSSSWGSPWPGSGGGSSPSRATTTHADVPAATSPKRTVTRPHHATKTVATIPASTVDPDAKGTGRPGHASVPILMYHVIADPIPGAAFPGLYVPVSEFASQMKALKNAGWHAVTQDQLLAHWRRGVSLGPGKPIVLTFDNGYHSQAVNAMPVLRKLGWVGVENIQLTGLPPSQGGLSRAEVRELLRAGWELDTQGRSHADLPAASAADLHNEVVNTRRILQQRYGVKVNWFCYPSGHYDATVVKAVKDAGYVGSTTVIPGWAHGSDDRYRLSRLRVLGGTSGPQLLDQIASAKSAGPAPDSYTSAGYPSAGETAPQLGDVAPSDRNLAAVGHQDQRRGVRQRSHLHRSPEVDEVATVHTDESVALPALLELGHRHPQQVALTA